MFALTETSSRLDLGFFARDTLTVASELVNKSLITMIDGVITGGRIVETEAYCGVGDAASHASRKMTPRNAVMFGRPGRAYVYFSYGMHNLFNVVTEIEGTPGAVLIRAIEPIHGLDTMRKRRCVKRDSQLCSGPGKLTSALGITLMNNKADLFDQRSEVFIIDEGFPSETVTTGPRIGISAATDLPWRFFLSHSPFISRP